MFWLAVPLSLAAAGVMGFSLPSSRPRAGIRYGELMRSLGSLWSDFPELRWSTMTQALLFGTFSVFWTILALRLEQPPFRLGPAAAGLFGIVGLVGILAAPVAGRVADRRGPRPVVVLGAVVVLLSWIVFGIWESMAGLVVGVVLLDFGIQSAIVSNQHIIYALRPDARARINTLFIGGMFLGGAAGAAAASAAWRLGDWHAVTGLGMLFAAAACAVQVLAARGRRRTGAEPVRFAPASVRSR